MRKQPLLAFGLLGIAGLAVFLGLYARSFPQATLRVQVTKGEAASIAERALADRGFDTEGYRSATAFQADPLPQTYLQRAWGIERANAEIVQDPELAQWGYVTRFFQELEPQEYVVLVDPRGEVAGLRRALPENASGAVLGKERARALALAFLRETLQRDPADWEDKDYAVEALARRTDHVFTFQRKGSRIPWSTDADAGQAAKRLEVTVQGDVIGGWVRTFFVPEDFARRQHTEDSFGMLYLALAGLAYFAMVVLGVVMLFRSMKRKDIRLEPFVWWGLAVVLANVLSLTGTTGGLLLQYPTEQPLLTFVTVLGVGVCVGLVIAGATSLLFAATGSALAREALPGCDDLAGERKSLAERFGDAAVGAGAALGFLGYITLFYYAGTKWLGIWSPVDPGVTEYMGGSLPFLAPIGLSLSAALTEEFAFRFFGVSVAKRFLKSTALAVILPAIVWAFLHSTYPVYPMHIRGVELTVGGALFGLLYLRRGILAAIVAHYLIDAILFSMPLIQSGNLGLRLQGILPIVFAVLIPVLAWAIDRRKGR